MDADWSAIRITSGTTIQTVVATSLAHLSNPSSGPLILHTLPTTSSSSLQKSRHAGLGKLISIVEIIKREFEQHQKEVAIAANEAKEGGSRNKGKKRAADQIDQAATTEEQEQDKENAGVEKPQFLRLYQYNELSCFERLASNNAQNGHQDDASDGPDEDEEAGDGDGEDDAGQAGGEPTEAQKRLSDAIENQVIRGRKRPRKKHTPCLKITLHSTRLPTYEAYLTSQNKDFTLQQPPKPSHNRKRKRPRKAKAAQQEHDDTADLQGVAGEGAQEQPEAMNMEISSVQNADAAPENENVQSDSQKTQSSGMGTVVTAPEPNATASTVLGQ